MSLKTLLSRLIGHPLASESGQEVAEDVIQSRRERAEVLRRQHQYRQAMVRYLGIDVDVVKRRR